MAKIDAKIKNIRVYSNSGLVRYRVTFDQSFEAVAKNADGMYVETTVNYIDFVPRVLIAQCLDIIEGLDLMYTKKKEQGLRNDGQGGFGAAELQVVLHDAKITMERDKFEEHTEYTDVYGITQTHAHAGYKTTITDIVVTERVRAKLDTMIDKMFDL